MNAEHHRNKKQPRQQRAAEGVAVEVQEQPGHAFEQLSADRHDYRKGHRAGDQQRQQRGQDHIEVIGDDFTQPLLQPGAEHRRQQHADNAAARIDSQAEEGLHAAVVAALRTRLIAENKQRGDNGAVYASAAKGFLRVITDQDAEKGEQPFAEQLHVADGVQQPGCMIARLVELEELFSQRREPQQQTGGDKARN